MALLYLAVRALCECQFEGYVNSMSRGAKSFCGFSQEVLLKKKKNAQINLALSTVSVFQ